MNNTRLPLALFFVTVAAMAYSAMGVFAKLALPHTPLNILLFFRFLILFVCMLPFVLSKDLSFIKTKHFGLHFLRAMSAVTAISLTFLSIQYIPLATVILLSSTEPLFVPFIFRVAKGTPILGRLFWGIGLGTLGIVFVLHPTQGFFHFAALLALGAGLTRALSISAVRTLTKSESTRTILFYFFFLGSVVTGFSTLPSWHHTTEWPWVLILGVGVSSFIFQLCLTQALRHAPARLITPFNYLAVIFTALVDWFLWHETLTWTTILGMFLVICGAILTVFLGKSLRSSTK